MLLKKEVKENSNFLLNFSLVVLLVSGSVYILYIWQSLIVPFIISILFSLAILWLSNLYKKIHIPSWIAFSLSVMSYFLIFYFIWLIIISNINDLILDAPTYQARITELIQKVEKIILPEWSKIDFSSIFSSINFQSVFNYILSAVTSISSSIWTILFYTIFILLESLYFEKKLKLMVSDDEKRRKFTNILSKIEKDVKWYFFIKTFISLITALFCYVIMLSFWLKYAAFWALVTFVLNFIPNIWSIIAVVFPSLFSFVQADFTMYTSLIMISLLTIVQLIVWNVVEPKMMWNRLNLSPLVIIIALSFWWYIWGIIGMLLSVPLVVIMNIILSKFEKTRPIAILLSEKGDLDENPEDSFIDNRAKVIDEIKKKFKKKNNKS